MAGRLSQGHIKEPKKFPLLVSQDSKRALLSLQHFHEVTLHGGAEFTVNFCREEFWIPNVKISVKKVIRECVKYSRFQNKIPYQLMAGLLAERLTPAKPFELCGLDLAGPIYTKPGVKTYIAISVSFVIKAVHIELVNRSNEGIMHFCHQEIHLETRSTKEVSQRQWNEFYWS